MNLKKIIDLIENKEFEKGLIEVNKLLNIEENVELFNLRGIILNAQNKTNEALEAFNEALKKDPKNIAVYKNLIAILINQNDDEKLIECYKKLIKIDKKNTSYYNNLAIIYDRNNKKEKAIKTINQAIMIDNNSEISHINKGIILFNKDEKETHKESKESLLKALELNQKNLNALFILGKILYEVGEYDESIKYLDSHNTINSKNEYAYYFKGKCLYKKTDYKESIICFTKALKINPNHIGSLNMMGNVLITTNKNKEAIKLFERSVNILNSQSKELTSRQDYSISYYGIGIAYRNIDDINNAELFLKKSIEYSPNYLDAQSQLAAIKLMKKDKNEDETLLSDILDENNSDKELTKIQELKNKIKDRLFTEVEKECREQLKLKNNNDKAMIYLILAHSLYGQFKIDEAIKYLDKSIKINPTITASYRLKADLLSRSNNNDEAIEICEKLISDNNKDVKTLIQLGFLYKKNDKHEKSKNIFKKALEVEPNNSHAQGGLSMTINTSLKNDEDAINESYKTLEMLGIEYAKQNSHKVSSLRHDIEQAKYLLEQGFNERKIIDFTRYGEIFLNYIRSKNKDAEKNSPKVILEKPIEDIKKIMMDYWSMPIVYNTKKIKYFLNPDNNWNEIEKKYLKSNPEFVIIDNFLSDEALIELRKFSLLSKVFLKEYTNDYLGAFGNMGFTSPVHIGIGRDLQAKMPNIFNNEFLNHMWAFKYDSKIGTGINVHADFAKVNLNFWITPDKYNLDSNSGGLKVYDTPPPDDWIFEKYNASKENTYEFLESVNAGYMSAHYKCNRAVLFNSSLFHETEEINFVDKYEGRRINVTYLFGRK